MVSNLVSHDGCASVNTSWHICNRSHWWHRLLVNCAYTIKKCDQHLLGGGGVSLISIPCFVFWFWEQTESTKTHHLSQMNLGNLHCSPLQMKLWEFSTRCAFCSDVELCGTNFKQTLFFPKSFLRMVPVISQLMSSSIIFNVIFRGQKLLNFFNHVSVSDGLRMTLFVSPEMSSLQNLATIQKHKHRTWFHQCREF